MTLPLTSARVLVIQGANASPCLAMTNFHQPPGFECNTRCYLGFDILRVAAYRFACFGTGRGCDLDVISLFVRSVTSEYRTFRCLLYNQGLFVLPARLVVLYLVLPARLRRRLCVSRHSVLDKKEGGMDEARED